MEYLIFHPIYKNRIWGGHNLSSVLHRNIKSNHVGESWDIVDRDTNVSIVSKGKFKGKSLREIIENHTFFLMGPKWSKYKKFPILVKILDCKQKLSLQVHPKFNRNNIEKKTENWYVLEATKGASVLLGLKEKISKNQFIKHLNYNNILNILNLIEIYKGDSIFVPSGILHAIYGGSLILEIQENSDSTYRIYDWNRLDYNGKVRSLDIKESLNNINFNKNIVNSIKNNNESSTILVNSNEFTIIKKRITKGDQLVISARDQVRILSVVENELIIRSHLSNTINIIKRGDNIILPYDCKFTIFTKKDYVVILLTQDFIQ